MRSQKRQQIKEKQFHNWINQGLLLISPDTNAQKYEKEMKSNEVKHGCFKQIINNLIVENSQLKKNIYGLEHQIAILRLQSEEKNIETKNVIRQYRKIINQLLQQNGQKEQNCYNSRMSDLFRQNSKIQRKLSFGQQINSRIRKSQSMIYVENQQQCYANPQACSKFKLAFEDYLNFDILNHETEKLETKAQIPQTSTSSFTNRLYQKKQDKYVEIQQIATQQKQTNLIKNNYKNSAETQRPKKQSKHSRRNSSITYSNSSFNAIMKKGEKNRQRVQQLLKNCRIKNQNRSLNKKQQKLY